VASNPVRISAHADHSARAKNRTIETFREAVATNADYVEFDIRRTADGELVAFHDPTTSQGHPLSAVGYAQLCDLAGYEVPKVADVLAVIKGRAKGHLDLKETGDE
jgi:glycerophosphoryl diester phosphodiesterase